MRKKALDLSDRELLDELYRNSYRIVLARAAQKLGNHARAEDILPQVYEALIPKLAKLRGLGIRLRVAYTVATVCNMCDKILERQKNMETRRYSYGGFELNDWDYLDGLCEEDKAILTERLDMFKCALGTLPVGDQARLKEHLIREAVKRGNKTDPASDEGLTSALAELCALLEQEVTP